MADDVLVVVVVIVGDGTGDEPGEPVVACDEQAATTSVEQAATSSRPVRSDRRDGAPSGHIGLVVAWRGPASRW